MKVLFAIDHGKDSGSGHLIRSAQVINSLISKNVEVYALIENLEDLQLDNPLKISCYILDNQLDFSEDSIPDLVKIAKSLGIQKIVVDSYKIKFVKNQFYDELEIYRIIDDRVKPLKGIHDLFIGIRNDHQYEDKNTVIYPTRNLDLIRSVRDKIKLKNKVLVYLGTAPSTNLVNHFITVFEELSPSIQKKIVFYIPPSKIDSFAKENDFEFTTDIDLVLKDTKLIIGAASSIIYEAAYLEIPVVPISLNDSQINSDSDYAKLGVYFNLTINEVERSARFIDFLNLIVGLENYSKFFVPLDCRLLKDSADFLAREILALPNRSVGHKRMRDLDCSNYRLAVPQDLLDLLNWRNKASVRVYMANTQEICKLDHYVWWLTNLRENIVYEVDSEKRLYLWHQEIALNQKSYLIGGWTPLNEDIELFEIWECLKWQLEETYKKFPTSKWLAVINKNNKVANFINERMGFILVDPKSDTFNVALDIFKIKQNYQDFNVIEFR